MRMKFKVLKLFVIALLIEWIEGKGTFTLIGPKTIKLRKDYQVTVTAQGYEQPEILEISIKGSAGTSNYYTPDYEEDHLEMQKDFKMVKNVTLRNSETQFVTFDIKDIPEGFYNIDVRTFSDEPFKQFRKLNMNTKTQTVFVQTDKSIYKPADKVQFRVLVLDGDMKPIKSSKAIQIQINDGAQNRVKQFDDITLKKGVYQNELQLSDMPVMGQWSIRVNIEGKEEKTKTFEVAEYTLPKFEVKIDSNPDISYKDGKIKATVKAKYTFGKVAKGNATIYAEVKRRRRYHSWGRRNDEQPQVRVIKSIEVDGKKPVEFDIENELNIKDKTSEKVVTLFASFKEELSGREQKATASVKIHQRPHYIDFDEYGHEFKPGLPFSVAAIVKYHDKNAPVDDKHNPVIFTIKYYYDILKTCKRRHYEARPYRRRYDRRSVDTQPPFETYKCRDEHHFNVTKEVFLSGGIAKINLNDIATNATKIIIKAEYLDSSRSSSNINRAKSYEDRFLQIQSESKNLKQSENARIDVISSHDLTRLVYHVIDSNGNVLASKSLEVPNTKTFSFEFMVTTKMAPKSSIIVYYITTSGEIISDKTQIEFDSDLANFVDIELSRNQAKPGEELEITVSSKPNSFIGLLGVDQSVLLLKKGNDIEKSEVFNEIEKFNTPTLYNYRGRYFYAESHKNFDDNNFITITNAKNDYREEYVPFDYEYDEEMDDDYSYNMERVSDSVSYSFRGSSLAAPAKPLTSTMEPVQRRVMASSSQVIAKPIIVRKTFPETWLFDSFELASNTHNATIMKKVPDTITSWIITGFSVDPITGLGLTRQPSKFNVFQPFFVSTNLPYSIKRGEVVAIPIVVFNYMEGDQIAEVTMFNEDQEFEFAEVNDEENQLKRRKRALDPQRRKSLIVKAQSGTSTSFMIRPLKVGHITIKVTANSAVAGDGVERQLIVEPEGVTQYKNEAVFIDLRNNPQFKTNITISVPPNAVPDSTRIEASAIGDILGPSIDNLDKLIKLPYGCGEQNMLNFVPNIVVLDYLTTLNKLTPEIEAKAKKYMESGYQRELGYKHDDGSYSAFGKSDDNGSTWLTAFVAKSFYQASKYIMVDEAIIKQALDFLVSIQAQNGSFPEVGHVSHKDMQGGSSNGIALTAYTVITFLENKEQLPNYQNAVNKALDFLVRSFNTVDDNYSLAIAAYALQLARHSSKDGFLSKLDTKSENKDGMKHWEKPIPLSDEKSPWYSQPNSVNIEMSAYALQAFVESGLVSDAVPIMKWLITQRNENGGFQSTQDTVIGIQALSNLATKIYTPNSRIDISMKYTDAAAANLNINSGNSLLLQKYELPTTVKDIEVTANGRGFGILQLSYQFNMNVTGAWPRFVLDPQVNRLSTKDFLHLTVCTSFVPDDISEKSNMAVMEVSMPSGYTFDADTIPFIRDIIKVKRVETKDDDTVVIVYFDDIDKKELCPVFKAYRTHKVANQKPAPVIIYDYYDTSRRATQFYRAKKADLCDICEGDDCGETCRIQAEKRVSERSQKSVVDPFAQVTETKGQANKISSPLTVFIVFAITKLMNLF